MLHSSKESSQIRGQGASGIEPGYFHFDHSCEYNTEVGPKLYFHLSLFIVVALPRIGTPDSLTVKHGPAAEGKGR